MKLKITTLLMAVIGIILMSGTLANAATVDVVQYSTGYFVPDQASTYNAPYYRWWDEDWGWTHNPIAETITSGAILNIDAWDVDASFGEVDVISAFDGGTGGLGWTVLGNLAGLDGAWGYSSFTLGSEFYDDVASGLQVYMNIDSTHTEDWWAVTLAKSALSVNGGNPPPPGPGTAIPEPATMSIFGLGLLGLFGLRKKRV